MTQKGQRGQNPLSDLLEDFDLRDLLEQLDVDLEDAFMAVFNAGLIDPVYLRRLHGVNLELEVSDE